jgi:phage recombination protein Bet
MNGKAMTAYAVEYSEDQIALLKRTICKDSTDDEFALFMGQCKRTGLDPFTKQIHAVKRWDKKAKKNVMSIQTGIDGYRLIAERTRQYEGQTPAMWCGEDGVWKDVWLSKDAPAAAKVGVHKQGFKEPVYAVALWSEYAQTYFDDNQWKLSPMWAKMGALMLSKCAEALALRKAFPQELSGIYTAEEMGQADREPEEKTRTRAQELGPFSVGKPMTEHLAELELREANNQASESKAKLEAFDAAVPPAEPKAVEVQLSQSDLGSIEVTIKSGGPIRKSKDGDPKPWTLYGIDTNEYGTIKTFSKTVYQMCGQALKEKRSIILHCEPSPKGPTIVEAEWPTAQPAGFPTP